MSTHFGARSVLARELPLIALLLLAVVLRAGVLYKFSGSLADDRDNYRRIADQIASGRGCVDPDALSPTAYRPPLYPLLLAAVHFCGGGDMAIGLVHLLLGVATVGLTVLCGRRLGLEQAGLAAGLLVGVDPLLLHQTVLVMTETLATFFAALLLWLSLARPAMNRNFAMGIVFGLCCLCRPTFWAFAALAVAVWVCIACCANKSDEDRVAARWRTTLWMAAGIALVIAPWGLRNALVMGRPIITTTHGGYTLLLAHNPEYTRAVVERPWGAVWEGDDLEHWKASLEAEMARETPPIDITHLSPAVELARDEWMSRKAREYIRSEPLVALKSGMTLLGRFWNVVPMQTKRTSLSPAIRLGIGSFYVMVLAAMLFGLIHVVRAESSLWWPIIALVVSFTAVHALYWADMRMRTPLVPAIALLAAASWRRGRGSRMESARSGGDAPATVHRVPQTDLSTSA